MLGNLFLYNLIFFVLEVFEFFLLLGEGWVDVSFDFVVCGFFRVLVFFCVDIYMDVYCYF